MQEEFLVPVLNPDTDTILYRSLRYNLDDGSQIPQGADLFVIPCPGRNAVFYFRYWAWKNPQHSCEVTTREEAVRFVRDQLTKPGLFSGWNHAALNIFLPEIYWIE